MMFPFQVLILTNARYLASWVGFEDSKLTETIIYLFKFGVKKWIY